MTYQTTPKYLSVVQEIPYFATVIKRKMAFFVYYRCNLHKIPVALTCCPKQAPCLIIITARAHSYVPNDDAKPSGTPFLHLLLPPLSPKSHPPIYKNHLFALSLSPPNTLGIHSINLSLRQTSNLAYKTFQVTIDSCEVQEHGAH